MDAEIIKLRDLEHVTSILVTHQLDDALYVASHRAVVDGAAIRIIPSGHPKNDDAEFMMLKDGRIYFEGGVAELQASRDPYIRKFLA